MSRRTLSTLGALAGLAALVLTLPASSAQAEPSVATARAQAAALAKQVAALQVQAEVATEAYDEAQERLGEVVSRYLTASQGVGDLTQARDALQTQNIQRVRALYMAGGQLGLYAQMLDGDSISDVMARYAAVGHVLDADRAALNKGDSTLAKAEADAAQLDQLADQRTQLEVQVQQAGARVTTLLAERQGQLSAANATVQRLVAEEQAREAAAAAAAAAKALATDIQAPVDLPPGTPAVVAAAITAARTRLGLPYVWGATGPNTFDCSGLTQWSYNQAGVHLPRTSREQWWVGPHPALSDLQPGDLLFWATNLSDPGSIHHVALYIGGGYMIEAPHPGAFVHVTKVYLDGYFGATRPTAAGA